jgi:hypothetical protein
MASNSRTWVVSMAAAIGAAAIATVTASAQGKAPAWASGLPDATVVKAFIASQVRKN